MLLSVLALVSCSSTKTAKQAPVNPLAYKTNLKYLEISGILNSTLPGAIQSVDFKIQIAERDSAAVYVYGPMKMLLARLYATPTYFLAMNSISYEAFEGNPTASNLSRVMNLPLSYNDLTCLVRGEVSSPPETFKQDLSYSKEGKLLFVSSNENYSDFALCSASDGILQQLQRKTTDGRMIFNVVYSSYKDYDGTKLAQKIVFNFADLNGTLTVNCDNIEVNQKQDKAFKFSLPGKLKINKLN